MPLYLVARHLKGRFATCLSGEGADYLLGGDPEYFDKNYFKKYARFRLPIAKKLGVEPSPKVFEELRRLNDAEGFDTYLERKFRVQHTV